MTLICSGFTQWGIFLITTSRPHWSDWGFLWTTQQVECLACVKYLVLREIFINYSKRYKMSQWRIMCPAGETPHHPEYGGVWWCRIKGVGGGQSDSALGDLTPAQHGVCPPFNPLIERRTWGLAGWRCGRFSSICMRLGCWETRGRKLEVGRRPSMWRGCNLL